MNSVQPSELLTWHTSPANTLSETLNRLYRGDLILSAPNRDSQRLVHAARDVLRDELGDAPRHAWSTMSEPTFFKAIGRLRRVIYLDESFHRLTRDCMSAFGFDESQCAFDPARLRVIMNDGHLNEAARPVYYPHRDLWYGHPRSLITWWIPLDDLDEAETFVFYPQAFHQPVSNDSEIFDYEEWTRRGWDLKIGWQDVESGRKARYPQHLGPPPDLEDGVGFRCVSGSQLLFSGAHFHQTRPQSLGTTRFSLDFRVVHLEDYRADQGAPRVDDRSVGDAVCDYVPAGEITWPASSSASASSAVARLAAP